MQALKDKGFGSAAEFWFAIPTTALDEEATKLASPLLPLAEQGGAATSALAGRFRRLWTVCNKIVANEDAAPSGVLPVLALQQQQQQQQLARVPPFPPLPGVSGGNKLGPDGRKKLEDDFLWQYPSERLADEERPSERLIEALWSQHQTKEYKFIPWRQVLSQAQADEVKCLSKKTGRPQTGEEKMLRMMAEAYELDQEEGEEVSSSPLRVQQLLQVRATALAVLGVCPLSLGKEYTARFIRAYSRVPSAGFNKPSATEAELVDKEFWRELGQLVRLGNYSLEEGWNELMLVRDFISRSLVGRQKWEGGRGLQGKQSSYYGRDKRSGGERQEEWKRSVRPRQDEGKGEQVGKGKGKGKGGPPKGKGKGGQRLGVCFDFEKGECNRGDECRFKHE